MFGHLNKYLCIRYHSSHFTLVATKELLSKANLCVTPARNSSAYSSFSETSQLFWKRLRLRGYPAKILLPIFKDISYSNRKKCFSKYNKYSRQRGVIFKTYVNCSHVGIKKVILKHLPNLNCTVSFESTNTLAHLCNDCLNITPSTQDSSHILQILLLCVAH